eukprot:1511221-Rhodomonas_salina.1
MPWPGRACALRGAETSSFAEQCPVLLVQCYASVVRCSVLGYAVPRRCAVLSRGAGPGCGHGDGRRQLQRAFHPRSDLPHYQASMVQGSDLM